jgi:threonine/homoserine/homoserine lactone efflux protein
MIRLVLLGIVAEMAVFGVGYLAPAMTTLLRPIYIFVAALFLFALWHAARRRPGHDRRHNAPGDRRHNDRRD